MISHDLSVCKLQWRTCILDWSIDCRRNVLARMGRSHFRTNPIMFAGCHFQFDNERFERISSDTKYKVRIALDSSLCFLSNSLKSICGITEIRMLSIGPREYRVNCCSCEL